MFILRLFLFILFFNNIFTFKHSNPVKVNFKLNMKKSKLSISHIYKPKSLNQNLYNEYLNNELFKIIISTGPAGTGKTLFACQKAIQLLKSQEIDKIIITRPIVTLEEDIGFLPGNIIKKMDPWTKPIFDLFLEYFSKSELDLYLYSEKIEICPLVFMRGRTFKNAFIIADEMQNSSPNQMKMLATRIGINSRLVITGDLNQTDIKMENGLFDIIKKIDNFNNSSLIKIVNLNNDDIERSSIVKEIIKIYNYKPKENIINIEKNISNSNCSFINSDCALIPKHHLSDNFDIFTNYNTL